MIKYKSGTRVVLQSGRVAYFQFVLDHEGHKVAVCTSDPLDTNKEWKGGTYFSVSLYEVRDQLEAV
jgi:hypothetical protein